MTQKTSILVSRQFTAFTGRGPCLAGDLPADALIFGFGDIGEPAVSMLGAADLNGPADDHLVVLALSRTAAERLFGLIPKADGRWYLPSDLRRYGRSLVEATGEGEAEDMLRAARSQELLYHLFAALKAERMVEVDGSISLSEGDITRVAAAHRIVTEQWHEKLTVSSVARHCGLSKAKLTRGFRELYQCTLPEAVAERRLQCASRLLAESDLPVSSIGYRCGYLSNASFTRAFARKFGMAPTEKRRLENRA